MFRVLNIYSKNVTKQNSKDALPPPLFYAYDNHYYTSSSISYFQQ